MICDISKHQGAIDWNLLAPQLDFVAIKASGLYANGADPYYARNVAGAVAHSLPIHVFHFLYCLTETAARRDARLFYETVRAQNVEPIAWVLDCEAEWGIEYDRARPVAEAFEAELRRLAGDDIRVAIYIAHGCYREYALDYAHYDYVWIPRYGKNDGTIEGSIKPDFPCDIWQYTSHGRLPGINGDVDMDVLMGTKPLSYFTTKGGNVQMAVMIGSARIDENGKASGGKAGDQTGKEVSRQKWYDQTDPKKAWRVFRAKDPEVAERTAQNMDWACDNNNIGYDQGQRLTLFNVAKPLGFNCKKVKTKCETDCSALVRVCCAYAGVTLPNFRTPSEPAALLNSGAFEELKGEKYSHHSTYLKRGDILVTSKQGHTVVVLTNGPKAGDDPAPEPKLGERDLRRGCKGDDVKELQEDLIKLGYALPKYGADGDFGKETEKAVQAFQLDHGLLADGVMNVGADYEALFSILNDAPAPPARYVEITGGSVNVRSAPGTTGTRVLGTAHKGDKLPWQGESMRADGRVWFLVEFKGKNGWVSEKYARLT